MFKLFVCISVLVAAISADYDFKDSDFNELLFDDLRLDFDDDFEESLRFRRDTEVAAGQKECHREKGKKDRVFHCCIGEKADSKQFEAMKEVKKKCIAEVRGENDETSFDPFDCTKMKAVKEQTVCTVECMSKQFDLLDESGALKREALVTHFRARVGDIKWKADAVEGYVDKCLADLKASKEKNDKTEDKDESKKGCNQCPLQFTHCIWREFVQGCPVESQVDSGKCKKIRERSAKGDTTYLNRSLLHHLRSRHEDKKDSE